MTHVFVVTVEGEGRFRSVWTSKSAAVAYCGTLHAETGLDAQVERTRLIRTPSFRR